MKKALLLMVVLMLGATLAFAQNGSIGIFADNAGTNCNLPATAGMQYYYFVHVNAIGATASQWSAPKPACLTATRLTDVTVFPVTLGNSQDGVTVGYPSCKTGTFHILSVIYMVTSATPCCYWPVVADPYLASGKIEIPDCFFELTYGTGGTGILNYGPNCNCNVPTEDTTWGQMKALYE